MVQTKSILIDVALDEYNNILEHAQQLGANISDFVLSALREQLEYLEDLRDVKDRDPNGPLKSWADVQKDLGLL